MGLGVGGIVSVGGGSSSAGSGSGIQVINPGNNTGPTIVFQGGSGIQITSPSPNVILIEASGTSSVTKFAASFVGITSGIFTHGLGTMDVIVQVRDNPGGGGRVLIPDYIIIDSPDFVSLIFNQPQSGRVVII